MIFFNAFQLAVLFASWPFIIGWLGNAPFKYSGALFCVAIVAYIVQFIFTIAAYSDAVKKM